MVSGSDVRDGVAAVYRTASDRELTFLAAGFAYYAFVSLIPLVLLALVAGSLLGGEALAERLVVLAGDFLPAAGEELLTDALTTEAGRTEATVVALALSAWGALKVFRGLSLAFDRVYGPAGENTLLETLVEAAGVLVAIVAALALMLVVGVVLSVAAGRVPLVGTVGWLVLLVGLTGVFLPVYYLLPPIDVAVGEALPGAAFAAVGWTLLQFGFQLYAANAGQYEAYGAVGAVILFVTWLYLAGIVILLGAVLNVVRSRPELAA